MFFKTSCFLALILNLGNVNASPSNSKPEPDQGKTPSYSNQLRINHESLCLFQEQIESTLRENRDAFSEKKIHDNHSVLQKFLNGQQLPTQENTLSISNNPFFLYQATVQIYCQNKLFLMIIGSVKSDEKTSIEQKLKNEDACKKALNFLLYGVEKEFQKDIYQLLSKGFNSFYETVIGSKLDPNNITSFKQIAKSQVKNRTE